MAFTIDEITHDTDIDAAYVRLVKMDDDERLTTLKVSDRSMYLDFDEDGHLVGIETLDASNDLPEELLDEAREL